MARSDPGDTIRFVPTRGDAGAATSPPIASPACNAGRPIALRAPFVDNRDRSRRLFSPAAVNIAAQAAGGAGRLRQDHLRRPAAGATNRRRSARWTSSSRRITRCSAATWPRRTTFRRRTGLAPENILTTTNAGFDNLAQSVALGDTLILGNNMVNAVRVTFNRTAIARIHEPSFNAPSVGIQRPQRAAGFPGARRHRRIQHRRQHAEPGDLRHQQLSGERGPEPRQGEPSVRRSAGTSRCGRSISLPSTRTRANFMFNGQATGLGLADFMLGRVSTFQQGSPTDWATKPDLSRRCTRRTRGVCRRG